LSNLSFISDIYLNIDKYEHYDYEKNLNLFEFIKSKNIFNNKSDYDFNKNYLKIIENSSNEYDNNIINLYKEYINNNNNLNKLSYLYQIDLFDKYHYSYLTNLFNIFIILSRLNKLDNFYPSFFRGIDYKYNKPDINLNIIQDTNKNNIQDNKNISLKSDINNNIKLLEENSISYYKFKNSSILKKIIYYILILKYNIDNYNDYK
jgi:hypothetical protein